MKRVLSIKWETILTIMMFVTTVVSYQVYQDLGQDWKELIVAMFCMSMTIVFLVGHNTIKEFRLVLKENWK